MQLGRYSVSTLRPAPILSITFSVDGRIFTIASETGYEIWRTWPLGLLRRISLPGTLGLVVPLPSSPLLVLQGGGTTPLYPPNKAVVYHDGLGTAIAELEFGERVRGIAARQSTICIALLHRVIAFEWGVGAKAMSGGDKGKAKDVTGGSSGFYLSKIGEWETTANPTGLMALATAPASTLLALSGRQPGHVQLVNLPPCPTSPSISSSRSTIPTPFRSPIILAHTHPLSSLACTASGSHLLTTSERGTLLRVWDTTRGRLERELRRGVDRAEMWGVRFEDGIFGGNGGDEGEKRRDELRRKGGRVVGWSDKGTVHVWGDEDSAGGSIKSSSTPNPNPPSLTHLLSRNLPLPKYFSSAASTAQYHLPRKNPHAFASYVGAAAGAAGLKSPDEFSPDDAEQDLAERFVVGWVEVDVEVPDEAVPTPELSTKRSSVGGVKIGSREERRSFGSDDTTRTATPAHMGGTRSETPTGNHTHRKSSTLHAHDRKQSISSFRSGKVKEKEKVMRKERQLIAITFAGDWYRLRIPDEGEEVEGTKKGKCELVEYRRLGVGGGGW